MSSSDDPLSGRHRRAASASVKLYRKLLVAYPQEFRQEYASEMARYFGEMCADALRRGGLTALAMVWVRTLYEIAVSARLERARTIPHNEIRPGDAMAASLCLFPGCGQAYNEQPVKTVIHVAGFIGCFLVPALWFQISAYWQVVLPLLFGMVTYSALDAWITARRIKALQHA